MKCTAFFAVSLASIFVAHCVVDPFHAAPDSTANDPLCAAISASMQRCVPPLACHQALLSSCQDLGGILSPAYTAGLRSCVEEGGDVLACASSALSEVEPSAAHRALVDAFCDHCALGVGGCQELLSSASGELAPVRSLVLALGEDVVADIEDACASDFGCAASFVSCAQGVLAERALPDEALGCLLQQLLEPDELATCDASGAGGSDGAGGSSAATGGGGSAMPSCGDGALEAGEECDDGNVDPDDGCHLCAVSCALGQSKIGTHCYQAFDIEVEWLAAEQMCASIPRGHLVTLADASENGEIAAIAESVDGGASFWIGLSDRAVEGQFEWVTGEHLVFSRWSAGEPNDQDGEDCVELSPGDARWNDEGCSDENRFVCEIEPAVLQP